MGVRSVIDIQVNSEQFDAFKKTFEDYQAGLKEMPGEWGKSEKVVDAMADSFERMTAFLLAQQNLLAQQRDDAEALRKTEGEAVKAKTAADQKQAKVLADRKKATEGMVKDTKAIAANIGSATMSLLKWVGIGGIVTGLLGAGGLFGLDRLAGSVGDARKSAQGLGVTTGDQKAFDINYGKYFDTKSVLSNVANAKSDLSRNWAFQAMGVSGSRERDPVDLAIEMMGKAKTIFDRGSGTEQEAKASGLLEFFTMDDLRTLHVMKQEEIRDTQRQMKEDKKALAVQDETSRKWQGFKRQLDLAGASIQATFVEKLTPLLPGLTKLSESVARIIGKFADYLASSGAVEAFGKKLEDWAKYLGSPEFQGKLKDFMEAVGIIGKGLYRLAIKLAWILGEDKHADVGAITADATSADANARRRAMLGVGGNGSGFGVGYGVNAPPVQGRWTYQSTNALQRAGDPTPGWKSDDAIGRAAAAQGVSDILLRRLYKAESNEGKNAGYSKAGAYGPFQFMPKTAQQYGITDRGDLDQSAAAAAKYMAYLLKLFKGDIEKAAAGYNWGEGNVLSAMRTGGGDWKRGTGMKGQPMPQETRDYIAKVATPIVQVRISNAPGNNANVSASVTQ